MLTEPHGVGLRDTAAGACRKRSNHWGYRGALKLKVVYQETDKTFAKCWQTFAKCWVKDDYQKRSAVLLLEVQRGPDMPSVVVVDLLALPEDHS